MESIDDLTLQFLANKHHYQRYLEKNEAAAVQDTVAQNLTHYRDRFLKLTQQLCIRHANIASELQLDNQNQTDDELNHEQLDQMYTIQECFEPSPIPSPDLPDSLHGDVYEAFTRYVESTIAYFRFVDRNENNSEQNDQTLSTSMCDPSGVDLHTVNSNTETTQTLDHFVTKTLNYPNAFIDAQTKVDSILVKKSQ